MVQDVNLSASKQTDCLAGCIFMGHVKSTVLVQDNKLPQVKTQEAQVFTRAY